MLFLACCGSTDCKEENLSKCSEYWWVGNGDVLVIWVNYGPELCKDLFFPLEILE